MVHAAVVVSGVLNQYLLYDHDQQQHYFLLLQHCYSNIGALDCSLFNEDVTVYCDRWMVMIHIGSLLVARYHMISINNTLSSVFQRIIQGLYHQ